MKKLFIFLSLFAIANLQSSDKFYSFSAKDVDDRLDIYVNDNLVYTFNRTGWLPEQCNTEFNLTPFLEDGENSVRFVVYEFGKYRWNADFKVFEDNVLIWEDKKSEGVKDGDSGFKYDNTIIINK